MPSGNSGTTQPQPRYPRTVIHCTRRRKPDPAQLRRADLQRLLIGVKTGLRVNIDTSKATRVNRHSLDALRPLSLFNTTSGPSVDHFDSRCAQLYLVLLTIRWPERPHVHGPLEPSFDKNQLDMGHITKWIQDARAGAKNKTELVYATFIIKNNLFEFCPNGKWS